MAAELKNNSGIIGENDRKEKDSHPDKRGRCLIDGVGYWISGWDKDGQYGPFISLSFTKMEDKHQPKPNRPGYDEQDSDNKIPF